ncbi:MAG: winged helix-turn-helix transcriptional regulator [Gemmatimonadetes bacterium]|nr:winged helix-turn-helix transcriptional regulator [Gemmatimonadota bacterium]
MPTATRSAVPTAADAAELYEALAALVRVYQFRDRDRICCHDVSVTQCHALEALARNGPCTLNELAALLYLDKSTASRVVQTLERKRYLTRREHPEDARAKVLEITPTGLALYQTIKADLVAEQAASMADLSADARRGAITLIKRLTRQAAERSGVGCGPASCGPSSRLPVAG